MSALKKTTDRSGVNKLREILNKVNAAGAVTCDFFFQMYYGTLCFSGPLP